MAIKMPEKTQEVLDRRLWNMVAIKIRGGNIKVAHAEEVLGNLTAARDGILAELSSLTDGDITQASMSKASTVTRNSFDERVFNKLQMDLAHYNQAIDRAQGALDGFIEERKGFLAEGRAIDKDLPGLKALIEARPPEGDTRRRIKLPIVPE